ncbi:MAG: hypothetical protein M3Q07_07340 [Pseudobdellovibrionaceae bacterium]|nr:hypothetical protein [Pseudobdellovibrionaceae bacterium]
MKKRLLAFLKSIKLYDPDDTLSLSNIAMMVLIGKLAVAQSLDWTVLTAFFITLLNHNSKKWFARAKAAKEIGDVAKVEALEKAVQGLNTALNMRKL